MKWTEEEFKAAQSRCEKPVVGRIVLGQPSPRDIQKGEIVGLWMNSAPKKKTVSICPACAASPFHCAAGGCECRCHGDPPEPKKKNKYGAVAVVVNGIRFASKREAARYAELGLLQKAGEIRGLTPHPVYPLEINSVSIGKYTADSWYERKTKDGWERVVEDVKSDATEMGREFRRTVKLMKALYGIDVEVAK